MATECEERSRYMMVAMTCSKLHLGKGGSAISAKPELLRRVSFHSSGALADTEANGWKTSPRREKHNKMTEKGSEPQWHRDKESLSNEVREHSMVRHVRLLC